MEVLLAVIGSSAMASIISGIFSLIKDRKSKDDGLEAGVQILLYDRIKHLCLKYCEAGHISSDDYEDLIKMHQVYHNSLHGNGFLDSEMESVGKLPKH